MDKIGVYLPHNRPISAHQIQKPPWDLALGVLFREICGICVSLWSEAALKRLWDLTSGVQFREICGICVSPKTSKRDLCEGVGIEIEWGWLQQPTSLKNKSMLRNC